MTKEKPRLRRPNPGAAGQGKTKSPPAKPSDRSPNSHTTGTSPSRTLYRKSLVFAKGYFALDNGEEQTPYPSGEPQGEPAGCDARDFAESGAGVAASSPAAPLRHIPSPQVGVHAAPPVRHASLPATCPRAAPAPAATSKTPPPKDGAPGSNPAPTAHPPAAPARAAATTAPSPDPDSLPWPSPYLLSLGSPARHNSPIAARAELSNDQTLPQPPSHGKMPFAGRLRRSKESALPQTHPLIRYLIHPRVS